MSLIINLKHFKRHIKNTIRRSQYCMSYLFERLLNKKIKNLHIGDVFENSKTSLDGDFPVWSMTPNELHCMTTFFDIDPVSPSGKYLIVTQVPIIERVPFPADKAHICVVSIEDGKTTIVAQTKGWGAQLGANAQWGLDDNTIFFNDVVNGKVHGVETKIDTLNRRLLDGPVFTLSVDKKYSYSANLKLINKLIPGYGVAEPIFNKFKSLPNHEKKEGIWRTDLMTGKSELFISIEKILSEISLQENLPTGKYYIFNVKVNLQHTKLLIVLFGRQIKNRIGPTLQLITFDLETKKIKLVLNDQAWSKGGHHPNWMPNGKDILMNLKYESKFMKFVIIDSETGSISVVAESFVGGGHPSVDPTGRYLMTDAYISEGLADDKGNVPIRLIDLTTNKENSIFRVNTKRLDGPCRIDPHPVWSTKYNQVFWNGILDNKRHVFCADLSKLFKNQENRNT